MENFPRFITKPLVRNILINCLSSLAGCAFLILLQWASSLASEMRTVERTRSPKLVPTEPADAQGRRQLHAAPEGRKPLGFRRNSPPS